MNIRSDGTQERSNQKLIIIESHSALVHTQPEMRHSTHTHKRLILSICVYTVYIYLYVYRCCVCMQRLIAFVCVSKVYTYRSETRDRGCIYPFISLMYILIYFSVAYSLKRGFAPLCAARVLLLLLTFQPPPTTFHIGKASRENGQRKKTK